MGTGRVIVRATAELFDALSSHLTEDTSTEQMAYAACRTNRVGEDTILLLVGILLPEDDDHARRSAAVVEPKAEFKRNVYALCQEAGCLVVDIHTHPHAGTPRFSGTDQEYGVPDAHYVAEYFPGPVGLTMLVFGNDMGGFDGQVWDTSRDMYRPVDEVQILGRGGRIMRREDRGTPSYVDPSLDRQLRVPGYRHDRIARQHVVIAGAGGNGARLVDEIAGLGLGSDGSITVVDDDDIEDSNRPRIPYATQEHIGRSKAELAAQHLRDRMPGADVRYHHCSIDDPRCVEALANATVVFGCGDNDGVRATLNECALRFLSVYIDLGCDIQAVEGEDGKELVAGGQVRVVLPGTNACLVCCGGYDPVAAAMDRMTEEQRETHAAVGYVRGMDDEPAASVSCLNAMAANYGILAFLALSHPDQCATWDYLRFDMLTGETFTAVSEQSPNCPACGPDGLLAQGVSGLAYAASHEQEFDELEANTREETVGASEGTVIGAEHRVDAVEA